MTSGDDFRYDFPWTLPPCEDTAMRIDRYDVIGMVLVAFVVVVWILHFTLPAPPPEPELGPGLPGPALQPGRPPAQL